jgi:hypothetical protein
MNISTQVNIKLLKHHILLTIKLNFGELKVVTQEAIVQVIALMVEVKHMVVDVVDLVHTHLVGFS